MTTIELKNQLPGRKFITVWIISFLLVMLVCLLMADNYRSRLKLQRDAQLEFLRSTRHVAYSLESFFEERIYELNTLAGSRAIVSCLANPSEMSVRDGSQLSMAPANENLDYILKNKKIAGNLIYHRFMLVGHDGKVLLDRFGASPKPDPAAVDLYSVFNGKPEQGIFSLKRNDHVVAVISVPCYRDEKYVASLLTIVNTDSIIRQMRGPASDDIKTTMILDGTDLCLLNRSPDTKVRLSILDRNLPVSQELFAVEADNHVRYLFARVPIQNTPFIMLNSARSDIFPAENPREILAAMVIVTALLFVSGIYAYRGAVINLILNVRLEEENIRQQALEKVNRQLKREVSHRRHKEVLLVEKESLLRATIESTAEGILVVDCNGQIADWNRSFRDIWKFPDIKPLVTLSEMKEFLLEQARDCELFIRQFSALYDTTQRFSGTLTLDSGSVIEYSARPLQVRNTPWGRVWTFRDITVHKWAEDSLQAAKDAAEQSNKAKTEFLANMSHELRTPLNAVIGFAEVLHGESLSESQNGYVENIHRSGINLLEMLDNLLLYSDIEAGRVTREIRKCGLWDMINRAKKRIRAALLKKNLQLDVICEKETPLDFDSDPYLITRILSAILDNACKFTEQGQIVVTISYFVYDYQPFIRFVIQDTGIGIPQDKLETIFEVFTQADGSMSRKYGGMGTGLTVVKKLVWLLGGKIQVQSEVGEGTTVTVTLPIKDNNTDSQACASDGNNQTVAAGNSSRV
jgi:signal transduction histidine kinase